MKREKDSNVYGEEEGRKSACKALYERIPLHHNIRSMKQKYFYFYMNLKDYEKKEAKKLNRKKWKRIRLKI